MLNQKLVFVLEGENDALAINLNNFCTVNFDDAKREFVVDYGTTERTVNMNDDKAYFALKDQMLEAITGEK
ncbi:hypothetical protein Dacet_1281 [Denitrovibrio acetiphilus DSM 12809]|uniref:Uncharacterized protein n=1 Tax=Denitrovibrio acetiphilus (strain DSM 12809 / NBRC 114555 / N2460) TaxID=522772 RepID=D4H7Q4_DENA2|nr:hypothetical protein [Denitrovibrio acetiphilus]ADD68053.1 hypothetical protein Dacet_1281 [Denitrovibrio acetiphilus DSM 12809]